MDFDKLQKEVMQNKKEKGFDTTNICQEFCLLYGEVGEAFDAYSKKKEDLGAELADIAIYLLGISEMLGFSLQDEIVKKMAINKARQYKEINGILLKVEESEEN
ncbi:MAG: hypothetical protein IJZ29_03960 [Clostridia bacterium]|nr:hypothetical protein [Clostridia bacterium]